MSKLFIEDTTLTSIAAAIREKSGSSSTYKPGEMPQAILDIASGVGGDFAVPNGILQPNKYYANETIAPYTFVNTFNPGLSKIAVAYESSSNLYLSKKDVNHNLKFIYTTFNNDYPENCSGLFYVWENSQIGGFACQSYNVTPDFKLNGNSYVYNLTSDTSLCNGSCSAIADLGNGFIAAAYYTAKNKLVLGVIDVSANGKGSIVIPSDPIVVSESAYNNAEHSRVFMKYLGNNLLILGYKKKYSSADSKFTLHLFQWDGYRGFTNCYSADTMGGLWYDEKPTNPFTDACRVKHCEFITNGNKGICNLYIDEPGKVNAEIAIPYVIYELSNSPGTYRIKCGLAQTYFSTCQVSDALLRGWTVPTANENEYIHFSAYPVTGTPTSPQAATSGGFYRIVNVDWNSEFYSYTGSGGVPTSTSLTIGNAINTIGATLGSTTLSSAAIRDIIRVNDTDYVLYFQNGGNPTTSYGSYMAFLQYNPETKTLTQFENVTSVGSTMGYGCKLVALGDTSFGFIRHDQYNNVYYEIWDINRNGSFPIIGRNSRETVSDYVYSLPNAECPGAEFTYPEGDDYIIFPTGDTTSESSPGYMYFAKFGKYTRYTVKPATGSITGITAEQCSNNVPGQIYTL